jgi:hypothetical protein
MLRHLRAFAWLRWTILRNSMTKRSRRDSLENLSGIGAVLVPILLVLLVLPVSVALFIAAFFGGRFVGTDPEAQEGVLAVSRFLLLLLTLAVLLAPLVRSGMGQGLNLGRILLLPIRIRVLHLTETVSAMADPWILVVLPALAALPAGMLAAGEGAGALCMLSCGVSFAVALACLGALVSFGSALLFRHRKRGELISLVLFSALSCAAFVPTLVATFLEEDGEQGASKRREEQMTRLVRTFPVYGQFLPSEQYARALYLASEGNVAGAGVSVTTLAGSAGLLYWLSTLAYRRLLEQPETGSRKRGDSNAVVRTYRLPGFSTATSAMALLQLRVAMRTIRIKSALFLTPLMLLLLYLLFTRRLDLEIPAWLAGELGPALAHAGILLGLLTLQPLWFNQFATDREGLSLLFSSPLSNRQIVEGKALACGMLFATFFLLCLVACLIVFPGGSPFLWLAAVANALSSFLLMSPLAAALSALLPRAADLNRMGSKGNAHPLAGLVASLASLAVLAPGTLLAAGGRFLGGSDLLGFTAAAVFSAFTVLLAAPLHRLAGAALDRRRENLAMVAQGR